MKDFVQNSQKITKYDRHEESQNVQQLEHYNYNSQNEATNLNILIYE